MKRSFFRFVALAWLGMIGTAFADGFILIDNPPPMVYPRIPPGPVPMPRPIPPPRYYAFAPLEVVYHHVNVRINNQVAVTAVDQEFYNPNSQSLEGTYLFPVPAGAQIDKFTMDIGGRPMAAELLPAAKARQIYEEIVRKMKDPALLEYAGRDVFKVRIFPIEPHSKKHVTISYTQVLKADSGLVNYLYPLNTEKFSAKPIASVSLKIELTSSRPLRSIYSPSHTVEIRRDGDQKATLGYESKDVKPDSDFQLFYGADREEIGLNLMAYKSGSDDGSFLLLATPGFAAKDKKIVPKDVAFVLDTSGSMAGDKLVQAKKALQFCVENLNDADRFEVIRFSTETEPLFERLADNTRENRTRALDFIKDLKPLGGTAIDEALAKALALRSANATRPYVIVFLTDGRPTVGTTDEDQIVASVRRRLTAGESGAPRVFCFGIGHDVNTHLLDKITEATKAFSQYVLPEEDIEVKVSSFFTKIKEPMLANVKISFPEDVRVTKTYPNPAPDLYRGEQLVLAGRYSGHGSGKILLEGTVNGEPQHFTYPVEFPSHADEFDFIPRLWATRRVGNLLDEIRLHGENAELKDEVTELARRYSIVTPYTAYLILEDEQQRHVPMPMQTMTQFQYDQPAQQLAARAWRQNQQDTSGGLAETSPRYGMPLPSASSPADAIAAGNAAAERSLSYVGGSASSAGPVTATTAPTPTRPQYSAPASTAAGRLLQYTQQTQFVQGRSFYQNGNQWIEARIQKMPNANKVRVQFNSTAYFDLAARHPQALAFLALGQNVQFVLDETIYDVYE
jgi:Ca-activated chloride channel homolog